MTAIHWKPLKMYRRKKLKFKEVMNDVKNKKRTKRKAKKRA